MVKAAFRVLTSVAPGFGPKCPATCAPFDFSAARQLTQDPFQITN